MNFYRELFTSLGTCQPSEILNSVQTMVSTNMNRQLSMEFTCKEVKCTLNQMAPLKAPGPDGVPLCSFKIIGA